MQMLTDTGPIGTPKHNDTDPNAGVGSTGAAEAMGAPTSPSPHTAATVATPTVSRRLMLDAFITTLLELAPPHHGPLARPVAAGGAEDPVYARTLERRVRQKGDSAGALRC
ncbi:Uncharacterised protein [Gordonia paraffinivorans]|uniref:Uncharacterized protein n=1 Tax=Gordonia paraffinivorans TaxID=175628 RepID=A0ABD7V4T8_9ACTN|nr:Uncharacterised protein [Gordonia paraffinivorans]